MDRTVVPQSQALQGVRRKEGACADSFQHRFRFLLQSSPTRLVRDHSLIVQRGKVDKLENGLVLSDYIAGLCATILPLLSNALQ